jgi:glycosyltransferase involved in cell wall biosynthesis
MKIIRYEIDSMSYQPLITVVIPSFNHGAWIGQAIDSVLNQTYTNLELLIIDNHSSDSTDEVIRNYKDDRISFIKVNNNDSIAFSRNVGIELGKGEWIAFLDSDDVWSLDKLERCSKFFQKNVDFIYHDLNVISETSSPPRVRKIASRKLKAPIFSDLIVKGNPIATSSVVVRSAIIRKVGGMNEDPQLRGVEDYNTWIKISRITDRFKVINRSLGIYRIHQKNLSLSSDVARVRNAINEFCPYLDRGQVIKLEANLSYALNRENYLDPNAHFEVKDLSYVMKYGDFSKKLRTTWMVIVSLMKKLV